MMTNKRIALVHTNSNEKNLTLENFEKKHLKGKNFILQYV